MLFSIIIKIKIAYIKNPKTTITAHLLMRNHYLQLHLCQKAVSSILRACDWRRKHFLSVVHLRIICGNISTTQNIGLATYPILLPTFQGQQISNTIHKRRKLKLNTTNVLHQYFPVVYNKMPMKKWTNQLAALESHPELQSLGHLWQ